MSHPFLCFLHLVNIDINFRDWHYTAAVSKASLDFFRHNFFIPLYKFVNAYTNKKLDKCVCVCVCVFVSREEM